MSLAEPCFSYIVRSAETNEIASIRLTAILERPSGHQKQSEYLNWKPRAIAKILGQLEDEVTFLKAEACWFPSFLMLSLF